MAGNLTAVVKGYKIGAHITAEARNQRAARMEGASGRRIDWIGYLTGNRHTLAAGHFNVRNGFQQLPGIGMKRIAENFIDRRHFTKSPQVHHPDIVGHVADDSQVMGDEKIGYQI